MRDVIPGRTWLISLFLAALCLLAGPGGSVYAVDPPAMGEIDVPEGQYYKVAPVLDLSFLDDELLDDGWFQYDSYSGAWTLLFEDNGTAAWTNETWTVPGFNVLSQGSHTIYFKASNMAGDVGGGSGEWSWQFYKDTVAPTMAAIPQAQDQYHGSAPVLSLQFNDNVALNSGSFQYDGFTGAWTPIFTDAGSAAWQNASWTMQGYDALPDGSHTIYFRSTDYAANTGGGAGAWNWDFVKDSTPPNNPGGVASSSHTVSEWSADPFIEVSWVDSIDTHAGLDGYSVVWDTSFNTIPSPVKNLEEEVRASSYTVTSSSGSIYFHIRPVDNVGNWGQTVHLGPFQVDITAPQAPTMLQGTFHTPGVWSTENTISVTWLDSVDSHSGLDGYSFAWTTASDTVPDQVKDIEEGLGGTTSPVLADSNSIYFHIRAVDTLGNWGQTAHLGPFYVDTTKPTMVPIIEDEDEYYRISPTFADFGFHDNLALDRALFQVNSIAGEWEIIFSSGSGQQWESANWSLPDFASLPQGENTVYFKAIDKAGNTEGESGEWSWTFLKDTVAPTLPTSLDSPSHDVETWSLDNTIQVTWTDGIDTRSGLAGYSILWNNFEDAVPNDVIDIEEGVGTLASPPLPDSNSIYFHIRAKDNAGNWSQTLTLGPFYVDTHAPTMVGLQELEGQYYNSVPVFDNLEFRDNVALDRIWYAIDQKSTWTSLVSDWTGVIWADEDWTLPVFANLTQGSHTVYFKAADKVGNTGGAGGEWSFHFFKDTIVPSATGTITPQNHQTGRWSGNGKITVNWNAATDAVSGIKGYSFVWDNTQTTDPDKVRDVDSNVTTATSPQLTSRYDHYFHIRALDNAGNWGPTRHLGPFAIDVDPPSRIIDLAVDTSARTSVVLTWTAPSDNHTGTSLYDVRFSTSPITADNWNSARQATGEPVPAAAGAPQQFRVSDLDNGIKYYFALKCQDRVFNFSELSNVVNSTTGNSPPALSGSVTPSSAYNSDAVIFSLLYSDGDNDAPVFVSVSIDGGTPEMLYPRPGQAEEYTAGIIYEWITSAAGLAPGFHTVQFHANDGMNDTVLSPADTGGLYILSSATYELEESMTGDTLDEDLTLTSQDEKVALSIAKNTVARDAAGDPLRNITIQETRPMTAPEYASFLGPVFDLGPEGATFDPPLNMTMTYDETLLPAGLTAGDIVIATFDESTGEWTDLEATVNTAAKTITIKISHFSLYGLIVRSNPADFEVAGLEISPEQAAPGDEVTVTATISNSGNIDGTYEAVLNVNGEAVQSQSVVVPGNSTANAVFQLPAGSIGIYEISVGAFSRQLDVQEPGTAEEPGEDPENTDVPGPALTNFLITDLSITQEVINPGDEVEVAVLVTSLADFSLSSELHLVINNAAAATQPVELEPGQTAEVTFVTVFEEEGTYHVRVGDVSLEVTVGSDQASTPLTQILTSPMTIAVVAIGFLLLLGLLFALIKVRKEGTAWLYNAVGKLAFWKKKEAEEAGETSPEMKTPASDEAPAPPKPAAAKAVIQATARLPMRLLQQVRAMDFSRFFARKEKSEVPDSESKAPKFRKLLQSASAGILKLLAVLQGLLNRGPKVKTDPESARIFNERGMEFQEQEDFDQAIAAHIEAIKLDPEYAEAYGNLGLAYQRINELIEAIKQLNRALELNPGLIEAYGNRGLVNKELGNREEAISDLEKFISMTDDPDYKSIAEEYLGELTN